MKECNTETGEGGCYHTGKAVVQDLLHIVDTLFTADLPSASHNWLNFRI